MNPQLRRIERDLLKAFAGIFFATYYLGISYGGVRRAKERLARIELERDQAQDDTTRLQRQLDGALDHIHTSKGAPTDIPGSDQGDQGIEPGSPVDGA